MIETITQLVRQKWNILPHSTLQMSSLHITKFCQRIVGENTKVLFLVTHENAALCIIKIMRSRSYDAMLRRESAAQQAVVSRGIAPRVYFEADIDRYLYAEEVIEGSPISMWKARRRESDIIKAILALPRSGRVTTREIADAFPPHESGDVRIAEYAAYLRARNLELERGHTHGDMGLPNIFIRHGNISIIDWGRSGDCPWYGIDAVQFFSRIHHIDTLAEWKRSAMQFKRVSGVSEEISTALYCLSSMYHVLFKKYPDAYYSLVGRFSL